MSLSEQEKNNLVNDGKFTQQQVDFFSDNGIRYDVIKNLQSATQEHLETQNRINNEEFSLELENINTQVTRYILGCFNQFQQPRQAQHSSRRDINHYIMAIISDISTQIEDLNDTEDDNPIVGGKRRKTQKNKRRLQSRRSKRRLRTRRRRTRAKKITKTR